MTFSVAGAVFGIERSLEDLEPTFVLRDCCRFQYAGTSGDRWGLCLGYILGGSRNTFERMVAKAKIVLELRCQLFL